MARASSTTILRATTSFVARVGREDVPVYEGDLAAPDSPVVRKYPTMFAAPLVRFPAEPAVEAATAAPGEKRGG